MTTELAKKLAIALFMALMAGGLVACDDQGLKSGCFVFVSCLL